MSKLTEVLNLIDMANRQDPHSEADSLGQPQPKEWLYGQRMSLCLAEFEPSASEHLQIAARGQHIERWQSPRTDYPEGRSGYKKWRAELGLYHARRVGELMEQVGYSADDIERTRYLIQKRGLKRDTETQCLEDVICLVFLRHYLEDFAAKHPEDKLIDIIQKTWVKMSDRGHAAALKLNLPANLTSLVSKALAS